MGQAYVTIIGAGVVGSAVAAKLAEKYPDQVIVLLEAGPRPAEGVTSRNSGVIHAGIYYPPASLKARTCIRGKGLLYEWAEKHGVPYRKCGKLIVARGDRQIATLESILRNARDSGAEDLTWLDAGGIVGREPGVQADAAIWSPSTGIIDPAELTRSLIRFGESHGLIVMMNHAVSGIYPEKSGFTLQTDQGPITTRAVVNAAGLVADELARLKGSTERVHYPCRGDYYRLRTSARFNSLIYPVKNSEDTGLGVHLTIDLEGNYRLGPDAEYVRDKDDFGDPQGDRAVMKEAQFREAARKLLGERFPFDIQYDTCGIRPKLRSPRESMEKDFVIAEDLPGWIDLVGIESPGLTASLAIAEIVAGKLGG